MILKHTNAKYQYITIYVHVWYKHYLHISLQLFSNQTSLFFPSEICRLGKSLHHVNNLPGSIPIA